MALSSGATFSEKVNEKGFSIHEPKEEIMSLVNKLLRKTQSSPPQFEREFFENTNRSDHPLRLARHTYQQLSETSKGQEEMYLFMVEDILYSSLYATFYEQLLFTIKENPALATPLIEAFEKDHDERERIIAEMTEYHLNYIINEGHCDGCPVCENHSDVDEIVKIFHSGDFEFFKDLYLGMQTIQFAMEELIFDLSPEREEWYQDYTAENISKFRQNIIDHVEKSAN